MDIVGIVAACMVGIYGFIEVLKRAVPQIPDKFYPLIAYLLSAGVTAIVAITQGLPFTEALIAFLSMGLGSGGVNGLVKTYLPGLAELGYRESEQKDVPTVVSPNDEYPE